MLYNPENVSVIIKDETAEDGIKELSLSKLAEMIKIPDAKKNIFIFGGTVCTDKWKAKGMINRLKRELGETKNARVLCLVYKDLPHGMSDEFYHRAADIIGNHFFDVCLKNQLPKKDTSEYITFPSVKRAGATMRQNMYFTHCFGSFMMESIEKRYQERVEELGFMPLEQDIILKQSLAVEHNNISINLGEYEPKLTHLQRETWSDDKRKERHYPKASINTYIQNEPLSDDEVLLVPLSKNEYMSLTKQITKDGYNEHNGAQWEKYKSASGEIEDNLCCGIMKYFINTNSPIEDIESLSYAAHQSRLMDNISYEDLNLILEYGKEYGEDFHRYRQKLNANTNLVAAKLKYFPD